MPNTLQRLPRYYIGISFGFFLKDEEFVSKAINEGSVDHDKFSASKVCQLANKMESSKATARHIKQVAGDPPGGPDQPNAPSVHRIIKWQVQEKETPNQVETHTA